MQTDQAPARLLTVRDVASRLGVRDSWVYAAAESGTLPSLRIGRYVRFEPAAIDAFIAASRRSGAHE